MNNASFGKDDGCQVAQEGIIFIYTTCIDSYESLGYNWITDRGVCADKRFFPVVGVAVKEFRAHMYPLKAKILRLIVEQVIFNGEFRIEASMRKEVVFRFNKEMETF